MDGEGVLRGGFALAEGMGRDLLGNASLLDSFLYSVLMEGVEAATFALLAGR